MNHLLFLNKCWGVDFLLTKRLEREKIEYDYISLFDENNINKEQYEKYDIRSTPVLLVLDKEEVVDRISSVNEIVEYLKNVSDNEISLGNKA